MARAGAASAYPGEIGDVGRPKPAGLAQYWVSPSCLRSPCASLKICLIATKSQSLTNRRKSLESCSRKSALRLIPFCSTGSSTRRMVRILAPIMLVMLIVIAEQEATILEQIRVTYLPQVILAFNSVLNFAGHAFSRDYMAKCMELATSVATDAHLSHACVTAKRMRDLTKAFAVSAKSMLYVDKSDKKKSKSSTLPEGANLEIWQVKPRDVGLA